MRSMLRKKIDNIRYALRGIQIAWQEELSFKIQVAAMVLAIVLASLLRVSQVEWLMTILAIGFVLSAEAFNTALEELCDKFKTDPDPHIGKIKDLAAAAVLIASLSALVVGAIIFVPKIVALF